MEIEKLANPRSEQYEKISLFYFLQYHLHQQLSEVHEYARDNGVAIKGDIPIGVSPRSVDAWVEPELFNTQVQAGAPPDDFSVTGQNWGFPTYNWEKMA
ncbi:4-alpha-glucanotransferase, partial [bacterium]|nr:4-alpha-glucanotransferase [bacterium]